MRLRRYLCPLWRWTMEADWALTVIPLSLSTGRWSSTCLPSSITPGGGGMTDRVQRRI